MRKLLELRSALNALKGPLGNVPAFKKKIQNDAGRRREPREAHEGARPRRRLRGLSSGGSTFTVED
jgi:hypothetical protein